MEATDYFSSTYNNFDTDDLLWGSTEENPSWINDENLDNFNH